MQFDLSNPEVLVRFIEDRPTMIEFMLPVDAFERPEAVLFSAMAEYLQSTAMEQVSVDAVTIKYDINEDLQKVITAAIYTRTPIPWVTYQDPGT